MTCRNKQGMNEVHDMLYCTVLYYTTVCVCQVKQKEKRRCPPGEIDLALSRCWWSAIRVTLGVFWVCTWLFCSFNNCNDQYYIVLLLYNYCTGTAVGYITCLHQFILLSDTLFCCILFYCVSCLLAILVVTIVPSPTSRTVLTKNKVYLQG